MLCPKCGGYATGEDILCPQCGSLLTHGEGQDTGVKSIRQGRGDSRVSASQSQFSPAHRASGSRTYVDASVRAAQSGHTNTNIHLWADPEIYDANGERMGTDKIRPLHEVSGGAITGGRLPDGTRAGRRRHKATRGGINWAYAIIALVLLILLALVGVYLYLNKTASGQVSMARMGFDAESAALWQVGVERMDTGDIDGAVEYFLLAREKDGEDNINVPGLLNLAGAYEADARMEEAEALYTEIYTEIAPSSPEAYRSMIRIMLAQGRDAEAAVLMQTAYEMTGQSTFRQQRTDMLPTTPTVDKVAGYHNEKISLTLFSQEGYDIYYTFDEEAILPEEGTLYTGPIPLNEEGEWPLRAVTVTDKLVSDPLKATYQVYMPTPLQPNANLAPKTYKNPQKVRLTPGKLTDEELEANPGYKKTLDDPVAQTITIYYTIDGSTPDADSPIFDYTDPDARIELPNGRVWLKAVSVNGYNKASNTKEVFYKITAKPWPKEPYQLADAIGNMKLYVTTREEFLGKHGQGESMEEVTLNGIDGVCQRYKYSWGHATMMKIKSGWVLAELYFTSSTFQGPRGTGIGDSESAITKEFQDMGQVESPSGNRGLYEDGNDKGKIYKQEDGSKIIRYITGTADGHLWQLDYIISSSGSCTAIHWLFLD